MIVDVMLPYWGDPELAEQTVRSVLAQTSPDWRLTVVDDAYPDLEFGEWVQSLGDDRIRYVRKDVNEGIVANFRSCVELATAPLMVMPGCDDRFLPTYVEALIDMAARHPDATIFQGGVQVIDEHGRRVHPLPDLVKQRVVKPGGPGTQVLAGERLATSLLHGDWLYWPSLAFRTEAVKRVGFRDGFTIILDLALVLDLVFTGASMVTWPEKGFQYRRHSESLSSKELLDGERFDGERRYFRIAAAQARELGWTRAARAALLHVTSRAYAGLTLPAALRARDGRAAASLVRHVLAV